MRMLSSFLLGSVTKGLGRLNRKATNLAPRLLCQSDHFNSFFFSKAISLEKSYIQYDSSSPCQRKAVVNSNNLYARFFSMRSEAKKQTKFDVEITSAEFIKPATPTPEHLRTYEVSLFDQIYPNIYIPSVYFYRNNHHQNDNDLILKRRQLLKQSLSETLTRFYPLAGRIKDCRHIDCNDDGVYYVEAKVNNVLLSDFLKQPDNKSIHHLLPVDPNSEELLSRNDLVMVKVTTFGCGGISIGVYTSHKIMDGFSIPTVFNAWAATAGAPPDQQIHPTFISSSYFPSDPSLPKSAKFLLVPEFSTRKLATKRFLFGASSLATLKQKADSSRVLAVTAFIWKHAVAAANPKSSNLVFTVSLRNRYSPPIPPHSIGNVVFTTFPIHYSSENDNLGELDSIAVKLKAAANQFSSEFLEKFKEKWLSNAEASLNEMKMWLDANKDAKNMVISSFCKSGRYAADFGWGKPIWICPGNGDSNSQTENLVVLMETRCGNGIEAWVTLSEQDMSVLERDPELLAFASLNANPLEPAE